MSGIGSGGIHEEITGPAVPVHYGLENSLCRWGTADVPEADEEYADGVSHVVVGVDGWGCW